MGRAFLPEFNEGTLTMSAVTLPGTSLAESDQLGSALERIMHTVPEVVSTARRTGRAELDEHVQGVESAEIDVDLKMKDRPKEAVLEEIRQKVTLLPGMNVSIGQPISHRIDHMLSGTRANIAVKIFGDDLATLRSLAKTCERSHAVDPGSRRSLVEQQTDIPTVKVKVDQTAVSRYGVRTGEVSEAIQTAFLGTEAGQVLEGQVSFPPGRAVRRRQSVQHGRDPAHADRYARRSKGSAVAACRDHAKTAGRTSSCGRACNDASWCNVMWQGATFAAS